MSNYSTFQITKCVKQKHVFEETSLFQDFGWMVNEGIRVGIESKITSKLALRNLVYDRFKNSYNTSFINMAVFKAHAILKNYRRVVKKKGYCKKPYIKKKFIVVDSCHIKLTGNYIHFSTKPRQFIAIKLNDYALSKLSQPDIKICNLIIKENEIVIPYTFSVQEKKPHGYLGIDMNFENITTYDTDKNESVNDMSKIINYKMKTREILSHFTRNDRRVRRKLVNKYGKKQRDREHNLLHYIANKIISQDKVPVLEKLKYIRNQGRKGDWKGKTFRFKLNSWSRFKLLHIIDYKSRQNAMIPIIVNPKGTSSKCSACGNKLKPEENRMMYCSTCKTNINRDVNAARNILKRGLFVDHTTGFEPDAPQGEVMKQSKDAEQIVAS